ncbi:MAG: hypothetical protein IT443_13040 [Phycisphaeraceae bacterium]|nr:hypothetical protein [Phycisphaeraceae bacterium]
MTQQAEPWEDPQVLQSLLDRWLQCLHEQGPMTDDEIARFCVRPIELSALLPDADRSALSMDTAEAFADFLADEGSFSPFAKSFHDWRKFLSIIRWSFKWTQLSPRLRILAQRRRVSLLTHAQHQQWIQRPANESRWHITPAGINSLNDDVSSSESSSAQ